MDFNNQIVGVLDINKPGWSAYFNVMMRNGKHGTIEYDNKKEIKMTKQEPVAKIVVYQPDSDFLRGFRFYSKSGEVLLEVGPCT